MNECQLLPLLVGEQSIFSLFEIKAILLQNLPNRQQLGGVQELALILILEDIKVLLKLC